MVLAAVFTYVLVPAVRRVALLVGAITPVRQRDVHQVPTPRLGGVAMYGGLVAAMLVAAQIPYLGRVFAGGASTLAALDLQQLRGEVVQHL